MKLKTDFCIEISIQFRTRMMFEKFILIKIVFFEFFPWWCLVKEFSIFCKKHPKIVIFEPFYDIQKPSLLYFSIYTLFLKIIKKNLLIFYLNKHILIIIKNRVYIVVQNKKFKQTGFLKIVKRFKNKVLRAFLAKNGIFLEQE